MAAEYEMRRSLRTQLREEEERRECTFAPKTSGRPRSVLGGRGRERYAPPSSDEKELAEHCTFKPRVNSFHVREEGRVAYGGGMDVKLEWGEGSPAYAGGG